MLSNCKTMLLSIMHIENYWIMGYAKLQHKPASKAGFLSTATITTLYKYKSKAS